MTKKKIWLSYDLGLKGDYNSLYRWLDNYKAKECGDSVAHFEKEFASDDLLQELKKEINDKVKLTPSDRIYVVIVDFTTLKANKAAFINGPRKRSPWEGYSDKTSDLQSDFQMNKTLLIDSCFWIGLVDTHDQYHDRSIALLELLDDNILLFPWPCLYETISTHLFRRKDRALYFESLLKKSNIKFLSDIEYRDNAMNSVFEENILYGKNISLTDAVLREVIKDIDVRIDYLITYNNEDFIDVCTLRGLEIF